MKLSLPPNYNNRHTTTYRPSPASADGGVADDTGKSPANFFWFLLHILCCVTNLVLGLCFSCLVFFLFFSTSTLYTFAPVLRATTTTTTTTTLTKTFTFSLPSHPLPPPPAALSIPNRTRSRVVVSRHGIRIHPWPYPQPKQGHEGPPHHQPGPARAVAPVWRQGPSPPRRRHAHLRPDLPGPPPLRPPSIPLARPLPHHLDHHRRA